MNGNAFYISKINSPGRLFTLPAKNHKNPFSFKDNIFRFKLFFLHTSNTQKEDKWGAIFSQLNEFHIP